MGEFSWVKSTGVGGGSRRAKSEFAGISKSAKTGDFSVILYEKGMKLTRWIKGDRVAIGFDLESGLIGVRRDSGGFCLTSNGGSQPVKPKSLRVTCRGHDGIKPFERVGLGVSDVQMIDDVLVISIPKALLV